MSKLLDLARAGYEFEKSAAKKEDKPGPGYRPSLIVGSYGGAAAGAIGAVKAIQGHEAAVAEGSKAKSTAKHVNGNVHKIIPATESLGHKALRKSTFLGSNFAKRNGVFAGLAAGAFAGSGVAHAAYKSMHKKASILDVAKGIASVGKNLVKQNPTAAKAALGGAVAGAVATKALQTKQASEKKPYGVLRHARDAALTAVDAYAGKAIGGVVAATTSKHQIPGRLHMQRVGFGKGLGMAAGAAIGVANSIGRREAHEKYAAAADKALQKEEKANGGPVNVSGGGTAPKAKSSLVASAKAEMAKAASKK